MVHSFDHIIYLLKNGAPDKQNQRIYLTIPHVIMTFQVC